MLFNSENNISKPRAWIKIVQHSGRPFTLCLCLDLCKSDHVNLISCSFSSLKNVPLLRTYPNPFRKSLVNHHTYKLSNLDNDNCALSHVPFCVKIFSPAFLCKTFMILNTILINNSEKECVFPILSMYPCCFITGAVLQNLLCTLSLYPI